MPIERIRKTRVKDAVYQQMLQAVLREEWKPGEKIPSENQLAQLFNVSRIAIRESIQKLVSLGILESKQGGGTYVCKMDGSQILTPIVPFVALNDISLKHMLEFRKIIEGGSAGLAAEQACANDITYLESNVAEMEANMGDIERRTSLDIEFHIYIAHMTKNPIIIQMYELLKPAWLENMRYIVQKMGSSKALYYHRALIHAFSEHSSMLAKAIMDEHILSTIQAMNTNTPAAAAR